MQCCLAILIICQLLTLSLSVSTIEEIDNDSAETKLKDANLNRRKLAIFPKNTIKFVVTPKPPTNMVYIHKPKDIIKPKNKVIPHFTPKPVVETSATLSRRKPLMKLRTFTVKSRANRKFDGVLKDSQANAHIMNKTINNIVMNTRRNPVIEQEDITTEVYTPEKSQANFKRLRFNQMPENDKAQHDEESDQLKDKFSFEEEQDRNEFIFLVNEKQERMVDMLDDISQDFEGDLGTTTKFKITEKIARVKRSNNIIKEENTMPTTVSGLKYTRRDTGFDNNFYFKNINS